MGGVGFLLKIPGGVLPGGVVEGGPRAREGVCGEFGEGGGGLNIFFGAEMPTKFRRTQIR